jgi:hypothetical protein
MKKIENLAIKTVQIRTHKDRLIFWMIPVETKPPGSVFAFRRVNIDK